MAPIGLTFCSTPVVRRDLYISSSQGPAPDAALTGETVAADDLHTPGGPVVIQKVQVELAADRRPVRPTAIWEVTIRQLAGTTDLVSG